MNNVKNTWTTLAPAQPVLPVTLAYARRNWRSWFQIPSWGLASPCSCGWVRSSQTPIYTMRLRPFEFSGVLLCFLWLLLLLEWVTESGGSRKNKKGSIKKQKIGDQKKQNKDLKKKQERKESQGEEGRKFELEGGWGEGAAPFFFDGVRSWDEQKRKETEDCTDVSWHLGRCKRGRGASTKAKV